MKILQITTRPHNRSGSGVQMMHLAIELAARGHEVVAAYSTALDEKTKLATDYAEDFLPFEGSGVELQRFPIKTVKLGFGSLSDILLIRKFIKANSFDLIHTHTSAIDHVFLATLGLDIPIIAQRGMCNKLNWRKGIKYRSARVKKIVAVSRNVKEVMAASGHIDAKKIEVVYGSFDPRKIFLAKTYSESRAALCIKDSEFVFGTVESLGGRKGIRDTLAAFERIAMEYPQATFVAVGFNDKQLEEEGIRIPDSCKDRLRCFGFRSNPEDFVSAMDTFVFSGTRGEGLTGAIREACAVGVPVISTDVGGNSELIEAGRTGLLVPPSNVDRLYCAMLRSLLDKEKSQEMALRAKTKVKQSMSIEKRTDNVLALYQDVLNYPQQAA